MLPADLYVRAGSRGESTTTAYFSEHDQRVLAAAPGVQRAEFSRFARVSLDPKRAPVTLVIRPFDPARPALPLMGRALSWTAQDPPPAWVSEALQELYGVDTGQRLRIPLAGGEHEFLVVGVWRDYARQTGAIALRDSDYQRITGDTMRTDAALWLVPGARANDVIEAVRDRLDVGAQAEFLQPGEIRRLSLDIFDRSFAVTYLLEIAAIVIGLIGIAATFSAQALARTKEFGMLRHLGVTRAQILAQFAIEGCWSPRSASPAGSRSVRGRSGADPRRQPAVVSLDDGAARAERTDRRADRRAAGHCSVDRAARRSPCGVGRRDTRCERGLVVVPSPRFRARFVPRPCGCTARRRGAVIKAHGSTKPELQC